MPEDERTARERIVLAAIECIEESSLERVTVRQIAAAAGVNVAAISYYFGSKEALLERALAQTLETGFSLSELYEALEEQGDVRAAVEWFALDYLASTLRWPRIAEAHLHAPLTRGEYPDALVGRLGAFLWGFLEVVEPLMPVADREEGLRAVIQFWSAVMFAGLLPGAFGGVAVDVTEESEREAYIRSLMDRFFPVAS